MTKTDSRWTTEPLQMFSWDVDLVLVKLLRRSMAAIAALVLPTMGLVVAESPAFALGTTSTIVGGYQHDCVIEYSGSTYCWGSNGSGQLGIGGGGSSSIPVAVTSDTWAKVTNANESVLLGLPGRSIVPMASSVLVH